MRETNWFRRTLLASAALVVTTGSAGADELSALKAQLEALQTRVNQLEPQPAASSQLPEGASFITFKRGTEATADWNTARVGDAVPTNRGFTIAITPTADLPAPLHEVTVSGYVKGDVIYDFDQDLGNAFSYTAINDDWQTQEHIRLHAYQSRFNVKSRSDTAIGQIRTLIEGDFFGGGGGGGFRLRHAWGEWDMTPNLTLGVGRYWRNFMSLITGISTVDFNGPIGLIGTTRNEQVRLAYHTGPMEFAISIEDPTGDNGDIFVNSGGFMVSARNASDNLPDLNARFQYDAPGGHQFLVSGMLRNLHTDSTLGGDTEAALGWALQGAANINLGGLAVLSSSVMYGDGIGNYLFGAPFAAYLDTNGEIHKVSGLGVFAGVGVNLTEATSLNVGWGWTRMDSGDIEDALDTFAGVTSGTTNTEIMSVHANIMWQPVQEMRLGWELIWAEREYKQGHFEVGRGQFVTDETADAMRAQFGTWFFF